MLYLLFDHRSFITSSRCAMQTLRQQIMSLDVLLTRVITKTLAASCLAKTTTSRVDVIWTRARIPEERQWTPRRSGACLTRPHLTTAHRNTRTTHQQAMNLDVLVDLRERCTNGCDKYGSSNPDKGMKPRGKAEGTTTMWYWLH